MKATFIPVTDVREGDRLVGGEVTGIRWSKSGRSVWFTMRRYDGTEKEWPRESAAAQTAVFTDDPGPQAGQEFTIPRGMSEYAGWRARLLHRIDHAGRRAAPGDDPSGTSRWLAVVLIPGSDEPRGDTFAIGDDALAAALTAEPWWLTAMPGEDPSGPYTEAEARERFAAGREAWPDQQVWRGPWPERLTPALPRWAEGQPAHDDEAAGWAAGLGGRELAGHLGRLAAAGYAYRPGQRAALLAEAARRLAGDDQPAALAHKLAGQMNETEGIPGFD
jgi:hypothetical protein